MTMPATGETAETPAPVVPAFPLSVYPLEDHRGVPAMLAVRQFEITSEPQVIRIIDADGKPLFGRIVDCFLNPPVVATKSGALVFLTATPLDDSLFSLRASAPIRRTKATLYVLGTK